MQTQMLLKLLSVARALDACGLHRECDAVTGVLVRNAQYNPYYGDIPMDSRVVKFDEGMDKEFQEADDSRVNFPRYKAPDYKYPAGDATEDPDGEKESIFGLNNEGGSGIAVTMNDRSSPGMQNGDMSDFSYEEAHDNNPFPMLPRFH